MMKSNQRWFSRWLEESCEFRRDELNFAKENLPSLCKLFKFDPPSYFFISLQDKEESFPAASERAVAICFSLMVIPFHYSSFLFIMRKLFIL